MAIELIIGTNTYCSLTTANSYFASRVINRYWSLIDDESKKQYLVTAYDVISNLPFVEEPIVNSVVASWAVYAQCLEACALYLLYSDGDLATRRSLQMQGVTQITIDQLKEIFNADHITIAGLYSKQAFDVLKTYLKRFPTKVYV